MNETIWAVLSMWDEINFEVKAFCGNKVVTREQLSRDLCYNKEMNSNLSYCDEHYKNTYPCTLEVAYYDHGALPIYLWNYNYGEAAKNLKVDLLNHPEYIEQNAMLTFQVAIWRWMTPIKEHQPSAHEVFIGTWTPTKSDNLVKRVSGFGATMNVLYGDLICGHGDNEYMNNIISHYLYYLDLMDIDREEVGPHEVLSCAKQVPWSGGSSTYSAARP
ncbi:chitinase-like protein 2 [Quercus suber]|uniref:chitinase-like protein 2 n=1 Tax=Quercus suber TaxID=58331 RepID=UPI0032DF14B6